MPKPTGALLDEIEWEDTPLIPGLGFGPNLNTNNILWYFMNSPFFDDKYSNNHLLLQALANSPNRDHFYQNRVNFQNELKRVYPDRGTSYFVTAEPAKEGEPWVVQKQAMGRDEEGRQTVEVQGVYYTVGNRIYMAPSLLDVMQARLHSVSYLISEMFTKGQSLDHWSPATGHTYLPPTYKSSKPPNAPSSRAGSVAPPDLDASQISSTTNPNSQHQQAPETSAFSDAFFLESLRLTNSYATEFMDENPLQGEPGAFVYASTREQVEARNKAQAEKQQQQQQQQQAQAHAAAASSTAVKGADVSESGANSGAPTPKAGVGGVAGAESRKGSVVGMPPEVKKKRRKSKGLASPITPTPPAGL